MKNNPKYTISIMSYLLSGALITACGGGGGGDGDNPNTNTAPEMTGTAAAFVQASKSYYFIPDAEDADGDALSFSVQNLPAWASFDTKTGELSGEPGELDVGQYNDITISASDGKDTTTLNAFSIDVLEPPLGRKNIGTDNATVIPTDTGYGAQGEVTVTTGGNTTALAEADLQFEFDAGDNLVNVTGTALLPTSISNYLGIENPLSVKIGLYTGAQINQDPDIGLDSTGGIRLIDDRQYLVFFIGADLGVTFQDKNNPNQVPITLGIGEAQSLIIMDPTDPFGYAFGYLDGVGYGKGQSDHGLIPFVPVFDNTGPDAFAALDSFYGHQVEKAVFPLGIKVFDVLSLSGTRVIRDPQFSDIDWTDPLNSAVHYQAGFNANAEFEFGVLGIGLFSYHLADVSATFDVGLQRQHFAMQGVYQPTETSQPVWLPVRPSPEPFDKVVASIVADGNGTFAMELRGQFQSSFPEARLYGSMVQTLDGLALTGRIDDNVNPITVSAQTDGAAFNATVQYAVDINADLQAKVTSEMDSKIAEVQAAVDELTNAITGYEFAVSLDGLRAQLPAIADTAITKLNAIPGGVYSTVRANVLSYINNGEYCKTFTVPTGNILPPYTKDVDICFAYKDYVNETNVANTAAAKAQTDAANAIAPYITVLQNMKQYANQADDEIVRAALKTALLEIYNNQTISQNISYTYKETISGSYLGIFPWSYNINKTFTHVINETVIPPATAAQIKTAADNVDKIPGAYEIVINVGDIVDSLPTEEAIAKAKQEVQNGLTLVPAFEGAGYSVTADGVRTGYIILDGKKETIQFNPLDPATVAAAIIEFITLSLIGPQ